MEKKRTIFRFLGVIRHRGPQKSLSKISKQSPKMATCVSSLVTDHLQTFPETLQSCRFVVRRTFRVLKQVCRPAFILLSSTLTDG